MKKTVLNKNKTLIELGDEFLVVCPHCASCASVIALDNPSPYVANVRRRFVCTACGATKDKVIKANGYGKARVSYEPKANYEVILIGDPCDWYFQLPLYLQIECSGNTLWGLNLEHLNYIENYIEAELRESHPYYLSVESRLPKWMKLAKNRSEVLRAIKKLKVKLNEKS
ncbi:hypothetical protein C1N83_20865 [Priestia aryabhattai]|uniref:Uncharacterized protein n=1 Tax=Priestia aryabhattai TaxID=412384 RepID=A0AAX6N2N7_PRIAR|nr:MULTISPECIES: hypothetical protein [Priestia]KZE14719.1 hypothetical protein AVW12_16950 [Priestia aryabhattai]MBY0007414.1 hypothetical protein [Priestia aryabhattai]MBY0048918.1 hypothetical protein [Priestia aryabhattai]MDE8674564.1 hypothetical protein [Priestia aryabhattai]MDU9690203.1 hypothetical protein [Priestia aryabhattai]